MVFLKVVVYGDVDKLLKLATRLLVIYLLLTVH